MSWLDKVKKYIKKLNGLDGNEELFIIVPKEEVDGINKWLKNYVNTSEDNWLEYDFLSIKNTTEFYILQLVKTEVYKSTYFSKLNMI